VCSDVFKESIDVTSRLAILSRISLSESSTRRHLFQDGICTVASG